MRGLVTLVRFDLRWRDFEECGRVCVYARQHGEGRRHFRLFCETTCGKDELGLLALTEVESLDLVLLGQWRARHIDVTPFLRLSARHFYVTLFSSSCRGFNMSLCRIP